MKSMRDFQCDSCNKTEERYIDSEIKTYPCSCGGQMNRMIGTPNVMLEGISGAFPGAHSKWARIREDKYAQRKKRE